MITLTFRRPSDPEVAEAARLLVADVETAVRKVSTYPVTCRFSEPGEPKVLADTETERAYAMRVLAPFARIALQAACVATDYTARVAQP